MPVTQYDIAPLAGPAMWGYLEHARMMRLATAIGKEPIEVSPVWFVVRRQAVYFPIDPTVGDPGRSTTPAPRALPEPGSGRGPAMVPHRRRPHRRLGPAPVAPGPDHGPQSSAEAPTEAKAMSDG